jgi:hypothetical protein
MFQQSCTESFVLQLTLGDGLFTVKVMQCSPHQLKNLSRRKGRRRPSSKNLFLENDPLSYFIHLLSALK